MKTNSRKIPAILFVVGLVAAIIASLLSCIIKTPAIVEQDFNYSVTYSANGETDTLTGVYRCQFVSVGEGTEPLMRHYTGYYLADSSEAYTENHIIARQDGLALCIVTRFTDQYLMGDPKGLIRSFTPFDPYFIVVDGEGIEYTDEEYIGKFDAAILSWEMPQPIENSFVFSGISALHDDSMFAMLIVGLLVIVASMILVRRDKTIPYKALDKVSIVLNFITVLVVIPFITLVVWLMQIYVSGDELIYLIDLCIPAITAFCIAASIVLRRQGFRKAGFFVTFVGPALYALMLALESTV